MSQDEDNKRLDQLLGFSPGFLDDEPELVAWRAANTRPCCVLQVGGFRPTGDPMASHIGLSPLMAADQDWPMDLAGQPMQFIAQLNVQAAPWHPPALDGVALLQLFVGERFIESGSEAGTYAIRTFASLDGLTPREQPPFRDDPWVGVGFEAQWRPVQDDHPCYDDGDMCLPAGMTEFPSEAHGECVSGTKIGGYATSLQHELQFYRYEPDADDVLRPSPLEPKYVLQIDSEGKAGLNWVDGGIVYLGKHPVTGAWSACCQFY